MWIILNISEYLEMFLTLLSRSVSDTSLDVEDRKCCHKKRRAGASGWDDMCSLMQLEHQVNGFPSNN
jgi:hypothetical protein